VHEFGTDSAAVILPRLPGIITFNIKRRMQFLREASILVQLCLEVAPSPEIIKDDLPFIPIHLHCSPVCLLNHIALIVGVIDFLYQQVVIHQSTIFLL
jgi:hypothetical protein